MNVRKNVNTLTATEKANLVAAIKALKANGKYDQYVHMHDDAMNQGTLMPGENPAPPESAYRNVAHRGPAFFPWHREFLRRFELDLQAEVPSVTLPYWDWTADSQLEDPKTAPVWGDDLMGGDGTSPIGFVETGPFRYIWNPPNNPDPNNWQIVPGDGDPRPGLRRTLGDKPHWPTREDVDAALKNTPYDSYQWNSNSTTFRNRLEGFVGPGIHNLVHRSVGGSMLPGTSPNDPVFFLHHCNVDRLWWHWQLLHPGYGYIPISGGPPGHNLTDKMTPWQMMTPSDVLDIYRLGYRYDTGSSLADLEDQLKVWTSVGSAGTLDQADLAKVHLFQSIVQLGEDITTQGALEAVTQGAVAAVRVSYPTIQAVVRYNITPVDGLFFLADKFRYQLQIRFRGHITAKLMQVDIESGAEIQLILFDSTNFPPKPGFQVQAVTLPNDSALLDFVNKGYYIEATLIKFAVVMGDPSAISVIKLVASPDFSG